MASLIIWMDSKKAKLFRLSSQGLTTHLIEDSGINHPVETQGKNHPIHQTDEERFYRKLSGELQHEISNEWLLMGNGVAKEHFQKHLEEYHPDLAGKVVGHRRIEELSDAQIVNQGKDFFKRHHLFHTS